MRGKAPIVAPCAVSSSGSARKPEGLNHRAVNRIEANPPGRRGNALSRPCTGPAVKPVTPITRLVAQVAPSVAIRWGLSVGLQGQPLLTLLLLLGVVCARSKAGQSSGPLHTISSVGRGPKGSLVQSSRSGHSYF